MKKTARKAWIAVLLLGGILLTGCRAAQTSEPVVYGAPGLTNLNAAGAESQSREPVPIPSESISQALYDALKEDWDSWYALSDSQRIISSHSPGCCTCGFDSWAECEAFLGFSILNPLEECSWLEQGSYLAMPVGYMDAPRVQLSWYGTKDGHIEWIDVAAGYRNGQVRVQLRAILYGDPAETKSRDKGWTLEHERLEYLDNLDAPDGSPLQISTRSTEDVFANIAYQAQGSVLYCLNVAGEPEEQTQVESTLEQTLDTFFPEYR